MIFVTRIATALVFLLVAACGPKALDEGGIDRHLTFEVVKIDPDAHKGKRMVVGGEIIAVRNLKETTEIDVLEKPLAADRSPQRLDLSRGRFILVEPSFVDPELLKAGRRLTATATVAGSRTQKIGESELIVPVFEAPKIHLWSVEPVYPQRYPHRHWWPEVDLGFGYYRGW